MKIIGRRWLAPVCSYSLRLVYIQLMFFWSLGASCFVVGKPCMDSEAVPAPSMTQNHLLEKPHSLSIPFERVEADVMIGLQAVSGSDGCQNKAGCFLMVRKCEASS